MHEPGIAITDFLLAIENALFAFLLSRTHGTNARLRLWFVVFFSAIAIGALLGGVTHGYLPDPNTASFAIVWRATMIVIGLAGLAAWMSAALLRGCRRAPIAERIIGWGLFLIFVVVVLFVSQHFKYVIAAYLPGTVFLLFSFFGWWRRATGHPPLLGVTGVLLTFTAAAVQQSSWSLHPVYANNNVLYHLIQAIALALVFVAARAAIRRLSANAAP